MQSVMTADHPDPSPLRVDGPNAADNLTTQSKLGAAPPAGNGPREE